MNLHMHSLILKRRKTQKQRSIGKKILKIKDLIQDMFNIQIIGVLEDENRKWKKKIEN